MTEQDLHELRRSKWRLDGKPIRTIEGARAFVDSVGFCLMYPARPAMPVPTFIGAFVGSDDRLPTWQHSYSDPRALEATELMVRLLRERSAYEANVFDENNAFLVAAAAFPFFYALVGERNPKLAPKSGARSHYSPLACDAFELIRRDGPISKQKLQESLGGSVSLPALDKALGELLAKLRITRVDYKSAEGSYWDVLYRWSPDAVKEGVGVSVQQAVSALLSKYLECVVAAEQSELETFFGKFVARSRVKEAVNALLAARELSFIHVGGRSMLQITPEKEVPVPRPIPEERNKTRDRFKREPFEKAFRPLSPSLDRKPPSDRPSPARPSPARPSPARPSPQRFASNRHGYNRSSSNPSSSNRPASNRPPSDRPSADRTSAKQPPSKRPPSGRPPYSRPASSRSSSSRPFSGRSSSARPPSRPPRSSRPSTGPPSPGRPSSGRPASGRPSSGKPKSQRSPSGRPPYNRRPPSSGPKVERPQPDAPKSGAEPSES